MYSYTDLKGNAKKRPSYITDNYYLRGYSNSLPAIIVNDNSYSETVAIPGNTIQFSNGEKFLIEDITKYDENLIIYLNTDLPLNYEKYGNLDEAIFIDCNNQPLPRCLLTPYYSQYGLQGKIFRFLARNHLEEKGLHFLCSFGTAAVFVLIVMLLAKKYNMLMAGVFYFTFWLSPWIVNFARNLYWVEFTWFIPMAIGLFCSLKIDSRKRRIVCYLATFISICVKCLCGYEYITTVMLGLISFLLVDLIMSMYSKDKEKFKLLFGTIFILGISALGGFSLALGIHAYIRGDGNFLTGIEIIYKYNALKYSNIVDFNNYSSNDFYLFNCSVWETLCKYFHFETEIITGLPGNLFPLLCIAPLIILFLEYIHQKKNEEEYNKNNFEMFILYAVFFIVSISWIVLLKGHSFVHTHMNFVLWYFGFIQICIYIIINKLIVKFLRVNK